MGKVWKIVNDEFKFSFLKTIIEHQQIAAMIAEMATGIEAARLLTQKSAWMIDNVYSWFW
jgi:alkylation response protein AidB-like acyl-CoA dehydrogenase